MNKKFARSFFSLFMALLMVLSLAVIPSSAAKVSLNKSSVSIVKGYSVTLSVNGTNKKVTWSSDDSSVADVSKKGKVTGKGLGTATISASFGKSVLKCKVTDKAGSVSTNGNKLSVEVGKTEPVLVKAVGIHDLVVKSSDESIAKATLSGSFTGNITSVNVKGVSDGTTKIKIYAKGYEKSIYKYLEVKVGKGKPTETVSSSGITVSADSVEVNENLTAKLTVKASSEILKKVTIVSTAKYNFDIDTKYDLEKGTANITISGYAEGDGNLRIFDSNDESVDIFIPVTVTNNAYDVVVWNREPKKRVSTDVIYVANSGYTKYYVLEPQDGDSAHAESLLAKHTEKYEYWTVYENRPKKELSTDVILSKREKLNGKKVTRYLLVEQGYDEAYSNSVFGQYFGVYDYYKVYATKPAAAKYGDSSAMFEYDIEINGKKEKEIRYILADGSVDEFRLDKVWRAYTKKYNINTWKRVY